MINLANTLTNYLPDLIVQGLAADPRPRETPLGTRMSAAVLSADISDFTSVSEQLAQQGPVGVEELSRFLNSYFGLLIATVTSYGGDVVKFAGDGLLIAWPADITGGLGLATRRAAGCAQQIQALMATSGLDHGPLRSLRIGIASGELVTAHLGGLDNRWEYFVGGDVLAEVSRAEGLAGPGQIVLGPSAWDVVGAAAQGSQLADRYARLDAIATDLPLPPPVVRPPLPPGAATALQSYLPKAVMARLAAGQSEWLAELRHVTVLFVNLPDLSHRSPLDVAQELVVTLQRTLHHYGGSLDKISIDAKGSTFVAAFGLPLLAHEDDTIRGTLAAMAIREALIERRMRGAIGVATGQAFCGTVGSEQRREFTVIGDVVNLGARLMQASAGLSDLLPAVLVDQATREAARNRIEFQPLPPRLVKGKTEPVSTFRPLRELRSIERAAAPTLLIGRQQERMQLADQIQNLLFGQSSAIIVQGEAGIGKSNLIDDFRRQATAWPVTLFTGAGNPIERTTAYHAWRPVFGQLFSINTIANPDAQRQQVLNWLADEKDLLPLASLLNPVLPFAIADTVESAALSGQARADNTRSLLIRCLERLASQLPKVIILENAQWLDSPSWALAAEIARRIDPLLLILVTRPLPEQKPAGLRQLQQSADLQMLVLQSLPDSDILAFARERLSVSRIAGDVEHMLVEKSEGNPYFCQELLHSLLERGILQVSDGACSFAPEANQEILTLPTTLQGMAVSRIDRLPPPEQLTIKVAGVIGQQFTLRALRAIYPIDADWPHLASYLDTLQRHGLLTRDSDDGNSYSFRHSTVREAAYNLLLYQQRRQLHLQATDWYESLYNEGIESDRPTAVQLLAHLVYHAHRAQDAGRERRYAREAAREAMAQFANLEAVGYLSRALALTAVTDYAGRYELLLARADIYNLLGNRAAEQVDLRQLRELVDLLGDDTCRVTVDLHDAAHALAIGDYLTGLKRARAARTLASSRALLHLVAAGQTCEGRILLRLGNLAAAEQALSGALETAQQIADATLTADALLGLGDVLTQQQRYEKARSLFGEALTLCRRTGDRRGESRSLARLGYATAVALGDEASATYYTQALELNRTIGDRQGEGEVLTRMGEAAAAQFQFAEAAQYLHDAWSIYLEIGDRDGQAHVLTQLGTNAHRQGDLLGARLYYEQALLTYQALGMRRREAACYAALALVEIHLQSPENGLAMGSQAIAMARELDDWRTLVDGWTYKGLAYLQMGAVVDARHAFRTAIAAGARHHRPVRARTASLGLAKTLQLLGDPLAAAARIEPILSRLSLGIPEDAIPLAEAIDPLLNHWLSYDILTAAGDARGGAVLEEAHALLAARSGDTQDSFAGLRFAEKIATRQAPTTAAESATDAYGR